MSEQIVYCVECLRRITKDYGAASSFINEPRYGHAGSNDVSGTMRPEQARYVVDGTWYCATHAIEVYAPDIHMIEEMA